MQYPANLIVFGFESDYREDLHFIPMSMRYRLDLCGIHLKLDTWQKMPVQKRFNLSAAAIDTGAEREEFRSRLLHLADLCGQGSEAPAILPPCEPEEWSGKVPPPETVRKACLDAKLHLEPQVWAGLPEIQRYALFKLSRSSHRGNTFVLALREFLRID